MNAAEALEMAFAAGVHIEIDRGDLLLEADSPPPDDVVEVLFHHKVGIIFLLKPAQIEWGEKNWQSFFEERATYSQQENGYDRISAELCAFEDCVDQWLVLNPPKPLPASQCLQCKQEILPRDAAVIPVAAGAEIGSLHPKCAGKWMISRRWEARQALLWLLQNSMGAGI